LFGDYVVFMQAHTYMNGFISVAISVKLHVIVLINLPYKTYQKFQYLCAFSSFALLEDE